MSAPDVGVYVHVPFCERVCPYCDFAVVAARRLTRADQDRYVDALVRELALRRPDFAGRTLASIYLGGGTPSLLEPELLARIVGAVRSAFPGSAPAETTLEVNPSTVERARLPAFRDAGIDRVSVGAQSFDDDTLKRLGRAHRAAEVHRTLDACREAGFVRVSLDLIVAAPGQTAARLDADLEAAIASTPDHVSAYELTFEPGTPFHTAVGRGQMTRPSEDAALALLQQAERRLLEAGYARYEISSYALPGGEARHNSRYWRRAPVLGIGVGAVSTDPPGPTSPHGSRRANPRGLDAWYAQVEADRPGEIETLDDAAARGEAVFLALRTARGLDAEGFATEFGKAPRHFFGSSIASLSRDGLLEEGPDGSLRLSPRGRWLSDSVFAHFV